MTVALAFAEWPAAMQAAFLRKPRQTAKALAETAPKTNAENNYIAEDAMPKMQGSQLGGRNRKGAGARRGNTNAAGGKLYRLRKARAAVQHHILRQKMTLLAYGAAIAHLEKLLAPPSNIFAKTIIVPRNSASSNNTKGIMQHPHAPPAEARITKPSHQ